MAHPSRFVVLLALLVLFSATVPSAENTHLIVTTAATWPPSPLTSCPGYAVPAGLPLIVQLGAGAEIPHVTRTAIFDGSGLLEHCVFDESTSRNRNSVEQALGRSILASRDAIILVPREPLRAGSRYHVHVEVSGRAIDWTFTVGG